MKLNIEAFKNLTLEQGGPCVEGRKYLESLCPFTETLDVSDPYVVAHFNHYWWELKKKQGSVFPLNGVLDAQDVVFDFINWPGTCHDHPYDLEGLILSGRDEVTSGEVSGNLLGDFKNGCFEDVDFHNLSGVRFYDCAFIRCTFPRHEHLAGEFNGCIFKEN